MEKEIIKSKTSIIPESRLEPGYIADDDEIWEENDGGAKFKVTRHSVYSPNGGKLEFISMSLSGIESEKIRVVNEFSEVFGLPAGRESFPNAVGKLDFLIWETSGQTHENVDKIN